MFVHPHLSTTQGVLFHSSKRPRRHTASTSNSSTQRSPQQQQQQQPQYQHYQHYPTARATVPIPEASSLPRTAPRSGHYYDMPVDSTSISYISAVAAAARNLYRRAKISGPDFAEIATAVRPLHSVLKHLRAEAEDADSLLNSDGYESSVYARQLTPIVEDTDFTLKQLDTILEKYGSYPSDGESPDSTRRRECANTSAKRMEDRERDMVALIRTKLANQKTNIDIFLDTVQLHNPTRQHKPVDLEHADGQHMDKIKDKVDVVAARLFQRRARALASGDAAQETEDQMWQEFWAELVKEGFSSDVLRKHKEVLRAYIRELDSNGYLDDKPPSVRGLLDQQLPQGRRGGAHAPQHHSPYPEAPAFGARQPQQSGSSPLPPPVEITPASYPSNPHGETTSPKEMVSPSMDNEKFMPSVKLERRQPEQWPAHGENRSPTTPAYNNPYIPQSQQGGHPPPPTSMPMQSSFERYSSDSCSDSGSTDSQQLALISTKDLMAMDRNETDNLSARMGGLGLSPAMLPTNSGVSPGTSPSMRYLPPPVGALAPDNPLSSSPQSQALQDASPRYVPPLPGYGSPTASTMTPPPAYASPNSYAAAPIPFPSSAPTSSAPGFPPPPTSAPRSQRYSRLAPDSVGNEIPIEAKWTRIKRSLVSTEVLTKAGVRYEARPDFVAVLGVLTKEQIADFARKSATLRAGRDRGYSDPKHRPSAYYPEEKRNTTGRRHLQHFDTDSETDSEDVIWDESDTTDSESRDRSGSLTDKYIPREHRRRRNRRASTNSTIQEEPESEEKGGDRKGHRVYPIIVEKTSPAAVAQPKPILKNRNENHVRFDEDGPREYSQEELEKERERKERRERRRAEREREGERRRRDRDRARERGGGGGGGGERDRERDRDRDRDRERDRDATRERERERDRDRDRDRDRERDRRDRDRDHHSSSSHYRPRERGTDRERDRGVDRDREREDTRDKRRAKKRVWGETLGAVGIGGAAASLLGVLTEAASGL